MKKLLPSIIVLLLPTLSSTSAFAADGRAQRSLERAAAMEIGERFGCVADLDPRHPGTRLQINVTDRAALPAMRVLAERHAGGAALRFRVVPKRYGFHVRRTIHLRLRAQSRPDFTVYAVEPGAAPSTCGYTRLYVLGQPTPERLHWAKAQQRRYGGDRVRLYYPRPDETVPS